MKEKHSEAQLQDCYEQQKSQISPPPALTEAVLNHANNTQKTPWRWLNWQYAAAMFIAVIVFGFNKNSATMPTGDTYVISATMDDHKQVTYYHDVQLQIQPDSRKSQPQHYQQYVASLAKLADNRRLSGVVQSIDDELVVQVCQVGVFQLSPEMVRNLLKTDSAPVMYVGTSIFLNTDSNGFIQSIESQSSPYQCPS